MKGNLSNRSVVPAVKTLVQALLNGIDTSFGSMLEDEKIIATAILHPKFKQDWSSDENTFKKVLPLI